MSAWWQAMLFLISLLVFLCVEGGLDQLSCLERQGCENSFRGACSGSKKRKIWDGERLRYQIR